jgi:hypothetical protein
MSNTHVDQPIIPISFFKNIEDSGQIKSFAQRGDFIRVRNPLYVTRDQEGQEFADNADFMLNDPITWDQFLFFLTSYAQLELEKKDDACLFAPTIFETKMRFNGNGAPYVGFRCKQNATLAAMAVLDADNKDGTTRLHIDEAITRLKQEDVEAVVYTTASNTDGYKFRIVVPLAAMVDPDTQQRVVRAVCRMLKVGWKSDGSRNNAYTLFYVPARYKGAVNYIEHIRGTFRTAEEWIGLYPEPDPKPAPKPRQEGPPPPPNPNCHWDAEIQGAHILDEYRSLSSDRHLAMSRWPVSLAMSALNHGYQITEDELFDIIEREHAHNPPTSKYRPHELRRLARESLEKAITNVGNDPAYLRKSWGEQELERDRAAAAMAMACPEDSADDSDGIEDWEPDSSTDRSVHESPRESSASDNHKSNAVPPQANAPFDVFGMITPEPVLRRDMLPEVIGEFAFDTADRLGSDPGMVTLAGLASCASALDDRIFIQPKENDTEWKERACLWLGGVGASGTSKSPSIKAATRPLEDVEKQWAIEDRKRFGEYERQQVLYDEQYAVWKQRTRTGEDTSLPPEEPEKPPYRQLLVNDMTMESLAQDVCADNPRGVLLMYDELAGLIGSLDSYKTNKGKDRPLLLQLWDYGPLRIKRSGRRIYCENFSASVLGGIQETKLAEMAPRMNGDGLMQRFLLARVSNRGRGLDRVPNLDAIQDYHNVIQSLTHQQEGWPVIVLSPGAQKYRREVEDVAYAIRDLPSMPPGMREHANKLHGLFARLLLTYHAIDCSPQFRDYQFSEVSEETARRARNIMV